MQCTLIARQPRREAPRRRAERGTESKEAKTSMAGCSCGVTPEAFIHRRVRPLDGWMVVANPYHLAAWPRPGLVLQAPKAVLWTMVHGPWSMCTTLGGHLLQTLRIKEGIKLLFIEEPIAIVVSIIECFAEKNHIRPPGRLIGSYIYMYI